jgi:hypothetical protein
MCGISLFNIVYFPILSHLYEPLTCSRDLDGKMVLSAYPTEACSGSTWKKAIITIILLTIFYVFIIPGLFLTYLYKNRHNMKTESVLNTIGVLTKPYKTRYAGWELIALAKRFLIVSLPNILSVSSSVRILIVVIVLITFMIIDAIAQPFVILSRNKFQVL